MKETMPDIVNNTWKKIPMVYKVCYLTSLTVGLIVHFFMLTNKITNIDDIICVPGVGGGPVLGRWFQEPVHDFFSPWSSPAFNGIMAILFISAAACFIVSSLGIKSITGAVLISVMLMTMPSIASNMYYMYLAPTFGFAILLSTINVYLTVKYRFGWIIGAVLQFFSMALYQAYFGFTTSLYVLIIILYLIDGKQVNEAFKKGVFCVINLALTMAAYLISLKFVDLSDYKGLSTIGQSSLTDVLHSIARAYHRVLQYFVMEPESFMVGSPTLFNRILCLLLVVLIVYLMIKQKVFTEKIRAILLIALLAVMPLSMGLVYVMASTVSHASTVMILSYVVLYFSLIAGMERIRINSDEKKTGFAAILTFAIFFGLIFEAYSEARIINNAYYRSYMAQHRVMEYYNRILTKLYDTEGYQYDDEVLLLGGFYPDPVPVSNHNMNGDELEDFEGATLEDHIFLPGNRERCLQLWFGVNTASISGDLRAEVMDTAEFEAMPIYPAEGCVQKINDIWVVKMGPDDSK